MPALPNLESPLFFTPVYKDYLWGGDAIPRRFGRQDAPARCAESWEISAHPDGMSVVADGPLAGRTLADLAREYGRALLGSRAPSATRFPLLFKLIDARDRLSIQIHPSAADPLANPDEIKNECWHSLGRTADASIFAGFKDGVADASAFADLSALPSLMRVHEPREGETLFIPSGLVHAIGAGNLVYEVQQSSNTTYRFYDWDRLDKFGKLRPLHVAEATRSIDWSLPPPSFTHPAPSGRPGVDLCLRTPFFTIYACIADAGVETAFDTAGESFHVVFVKSGAYTLRCGAGIHALAAGTSALLPACLGGYSLAKNTGEGSALVTTL